MSFKPLQNIFEKFVNKRSDDEEEIDTKDYEAIELEANGLMPYY